MPDCRALGLGGRYAPLLVGRNALSFVGRYAQAVVGRYAHLEIIEKSLRDH